MSGFKCRTCKREASFQTRQHGVAAGWAFAEVWASESSGVKYFVFCEKHVPGWIREAVPDGGDSEGGGGRRGRRDA